MYGLRRQLLQALLEMARQYGIEKLILFGSRARGDNKERSDIDLAVSGGNISAFAAAVDEELPTLLLVDVVNLDAAVDEDLRQSIKREGIVLYEKIR
ncbi:MAG: nucleotidyltransferase domain-containing protein [Phascolarctobacterium sp.]|uniref:nucleotidyltransferase family protein n=1 Tax=Phascolarctobacterium sp. TaxID=2049039 RepID=UPI0026DAF658|nr:nucleotidyltransferase domain-containing protein [Phascolarctobacterium sp.]MDO4920310.1 nucleotidyltransferase domain-containing protein [Phascolarctobacterium sp.]